jgi:hypothetical protein
LKDIKSALGQYFQFVKDMETNVKWTNNILVSEFRMLKFVEFFDEMGKSPKTVHNKVKYWELVCYFIFIFIYFYILFIYLYLYLYLYLY